MWFHIQSNSDSLSTHRINVQKPKFQFWEVTQIYAPAHPLPLCNCCSASHSDEPLMPTLTCVELTQAADSPKKGNVESSDQAQLFCAWGISRPRAQPCWVRPPLLRSDMLWRHRSLIALSTHCPLTPFLSHLATQPHLQVIIRLSRHLPASYFS